MAGRLRERVVESLLGFKFWIDQPGLDAMCYFTENHQLVWHAAELLVGELFADEVFSNTGWTGSAHAAHGRELAMEWMRRKLAGGFSEFDSNAYLAIDSLALCSLVEFADDDRSPRSSPSACSTRSCSRWRRTRGAASTVPPTVAPTCRRCGRRGFEETAPIMWALWGMGSLNNAVLPATVLSTARRYRVPPVVRAIATDLPDEWDGRQVYRGEYRLAPRPARTPVRLRRARVADARTRCCRASRTTGSGLPGLQEHIWGATLVARDPGVRHASGGRHRAARRPGRTAGPASGCCPRARQHRGTARPSSPSGHRPRGHTHLWFPAPLMDESAGAVRGWPVESATGTSPSPPTAGSTRRRRGTRPARRGHPAATAGHTWRPSVGPPSTAPSIEFVAALAEPEFGATGDEDPSVTWTDLDGHALTLRWSGRSPSTASPSTLTPTAGPSSLPTSSTRLSRRVSAIAFWCAEWAGERLELDLRRRRLDPPSAPGERGSRRNATDPRRATQ